MSSFFALHGLIEDVPLSEIVRFLHSTSRTGLLGITSGDEAGAIYFTHGTVMDMECHYLSGTNALDHIASFKSGKFEWFNDVLAPSDGLKNVSSNELIQYFDTKIRIARAENGTASVVFESSGGAAVPKEFDFAHYAEAPTELPAIANGDAYDPHHLAKTVRLPLLDSFEEEAPEPHPLSGIKAQELVQVFCLNGRDIRLTIVSQTGVQGEILIWRGRLYDAVFGSLIGDEAFYEMVSLQHPKLMIEELYEEPGFSVTSTWEHLLMEAAMKQDLKVEGRG